MMNTGWFSRSSNQQPSYARVRRTAVGVAILLLSISIAAAQNPADPAPGAQMSVPAGYSIHSSVDAGGRLAYTVGSMAMYDTMVNLQSGPRLLGQTFEMRALPGNKHPLFDNLSAFSSGYGGEPYDFTKMSFSKGKLYEFSGLFRRDRQYADYNLIGNPMIVSGYSIPIGPNTAPTGSYAWPQVVDSPFLFNTVRRMTDTNLTLLPLSTFSFRFGYSQNIFQGPSRTPSGDGVGGQEVVLEEFQRNSTDVFTGGIDWKPIQGTKLTFDEEIDHYRGDSYFVMDPAYFTVQEADGTKVALDASYQSQTPYGYSSSTGAFLASSNCNSTSMISTSTILRANPAGGLPIIDPACNVISSYLRQQPTREIFPTEILRLQSSSLANISMNGNIRYTSANLNLPNYYEIYQGLDKNDRELATSGNAHSKREVMAVDYGIVWQASKTVAIEDQLNFSNAKQPGSVSFTGGTTVTVPTTAGAETINNTNLTSTPATSGSGPGAPGEGSPGIGASDSGYFGQRFVTNNFTVSWDATPRSTFSLTYRHNNHVITEGANFSTPVQTGVCPGNVPQAFCGTVTINEDGGIFNAALRPASNWELNGTVEMLYDDNVFTPVAPRQTQHYRVHTLYRPKPWATLSAAYNDLERHNNTNNTGTVSLAADGVTPMAIEHADHSRVLSLSAAVYPNPHYGFDVSYGYADVYTSTNTCYQAAATVQPALTAGGPTTVIPGAAYETAPGTPTALLCGLVPAESGHGVTVFLGPVKDFADAPTQYGSAAVTLSPVDKIRYGMGYRISEVNGSRLFSQAQDVAGSLVSTYKFPYVNLAYKVRRDLTLKGEYNFYEYGEGGQSGSQYCNNVATYVATGPGAYTGTTIPVVPCSSIPNTAMSPGTPFWGFTAPRNYHSNNLTLGMHYEF